MSTITVLTSPDDLQRHQPMTVSDLAALLGQPLAAVSALVTRLARAFLDGRMYRRIPASHVLHMFEPREYVAAVLDFARSLPTGTGRA